MTVTAEFVDALPKVELHVHLEGSVLPATLLELATKHETTALPRRLDELREFYRFRDFDHFVEVYYAICDNLLDEDDFARIAYETGVELAAQGVRWAELTFTPYNHLRRGISAERMFAGIEAGRDDARRATGIEMRWCTDVPGEYGPEAAEATLEAIERVRPDGLISFGLGGPEVARPAFADAFARAQAMGLHAVPHAGETTGPQAIWDALTHLGAERIGHGVRCLEDPELVAYLRDRQIPLEVCPTSNVCLSVVDSYAAHPLTRLLDEGLVVTLNSDDPPMFGTTLRDEYLIAVDTIGVSLEGLRELAAAGVRASFMAEADKRALLDEIATVTAPSNV
jgi:aminodeoxyfutalosine deaminase